MRFKIPEFHAKRINYSENIPDQISRFVLENPWNFRRVWMQRSCPVGFSRLSILSPASADDLQIAISNWLESRPSDSSVGHLGSDCCFGNWTLAQNHKWSFLILYELLTWLQTHLLDWTTLLQYIIDFSKYCISPHCISFSLQVLKKLIPPCWNVLSPCVEIGSWSRYHL